MTADPIQTLRDGEWLIRHTDRTTVDRIAVKQVGGGTEPCVDIQTDGTFTARYADGRTFVYPPSAIYSFQWRSLPTSEPMTTPIRELHGTLNEFETLAQGRFPITVKKSRAALTQVENLVRAAQALQWSHGNPNDDVYEQGTFTNGGDYVSKTRLEELAAALAPFGDTP